ncbi:Centrosomal protein, partial [Globisporangium splendens]
MLAADAPHSAVHRRTAAAGPMRGLEVGRDAVDPRGDHRVRQLRRQATSLTGQEDPHDLVALVHGLVTNRVPVPHFNINLLSLSSIAKDELDSLRERQQQRWYQHPSNDSGKMLSLLKTTKSNRSITPFPMAPPSLQAAKSCPLDLMKPTGIVPEIRRTSASQLSTAEKNVMLIRETLRLLHQIERIAVVEFIETVVPAFYAIYITILFQLPNARYYQDIDVLTEAKLQSVILRILICAALELLTIMHLYYTLKRNFGISAFYQLAFTLENEWQIYHYNFQDWTLVVFQFVLVHTVQIGDYVSHVKPRGKTPATVVGSSTLCYVQSVEKSVRRLHAGEAESWGGVHRKTPHLLALHRPQLLIAYAVYVAILFHSPNVRHYQDTDELTHEKLKAVVTNILMNGAMELLGLLHVERKLERQFGVSVCYQLALALENEWRIYQCLFSAWVIVVFQFSLAHSGTLAGHVESNRRLGGSATTSSKTTTRCGLFTQIQVDQQRVKAGETSGIYEKSRTAVRTLALLYSGQRRTVHNKPAWCVQWPLGRAPLFQGQEHMQQDAVAVDVVFLPHFANHVRGASSVFQALPFTLFAEGATTIRRDTPPLRLGKAAMREHLILESFVMDTTSAEFKAALRDHAVSLGVDPDAEPHLMAVVEEALLVALPDGWEQGETEDGTLYYFNSNTEESIWEHPLDEHYREVIQTKKSEHANSTKQQGKSLESDSPSSSTKSHQPAATISSSATDVVVPKPSAISSVEVYSFDKDSDEDQLSAKLTSTKSDDTTKGAHISSLFPQPVPSFSSTSAMMAAATKRESIASSVLGGNKTVAGAGTTTSSGGFGRDRSWLLDGDDDDNDNIPTLGSAGSTVVTTLATLSKIDSFGQKEGDVFDSNSRSLFSTGIGSRGGNTAAALSSSSSSLSSSGANLPFSSRMYGSSSTASASSAMATGVAGVPATSMVLEASGGAGGTTSSTSPTQSSAVASSKASPRRGIGTTIKGQFFQEMTANSTTPLVTGLGSGNDMAQQSSLAADLAKIQQLEKKSSDLTKQNDILVSEVKQVKQQLEQARLEAKESNYLKTKANESKAKLAEKENEIQKLTQDHSASISKLHHEIEQLKGEKEQLVQTQQQNASSSSKDVMEMKQSAAETSALQKQPSELTQQLSATQQEAREKEKQKQELSDSITKLQVTIEREQREHTSEICALRGNMTQKQQDHEKELAVLQGQLDSIKQEMAEKERRTESVGVLQDTLERQSKFIKDLEDKNKAIQLKLADAEAREASALREVKQRDQDLSDVAKKLASTVAALEAKESQVSVLNEKVLVQLDQVSSLESKSSTWSRQGEEYKRDKNVAERERRDLTNELRDKSDEVQKLQSQIRKQHEEQLAVVSTLQMEIQELQNQLKMLKMQELTRLEKQNDQINRENDRLNERIAMQDKELRQSKQELETTSNHIHRLQVEIENWKRKEQQQKAQKDMHAHEKSALEKHLASLEAEHSSYKNEKRLEIEKITFRMRELESQIAQKDYEILRVEERFTKAEAWRLKEARRVEERDGQLLDVKEELVQLKNRNIEAENNVAIQELRREREQFQHRIAQLTQQLDGEKVARQVSGQKFHDELDMTQKGLEWQLPQLAAACVNRSSEEWVRKCHQVVKALRDDFNMKALTERNELMTKIKRVEDARGHVEQKYKNVLAECDFLRKEVHRVEDNNKVLLDQLHTIRVYMTQRSMAPSMMSPFPASWAHANASNTGHHPPGSSGATGPPSQNVSPPPPPPAPVSFGAPLTDFSTINHLNTQLGILHSQFQQLFNATERRPPGISIHKPSQSFAPCYSASDRFEISSSPITKQQHTSDTRCERPAGSREHSELDQTMDALLDQSLETALDNGGRSSNRSQTFQQEKEELISALASIGVSSGDCPAPSSLLIVSPPLHDGAGFVTSGDQTGAAWYQKDYWRRKYS